MASVAVQLPMFIVVLGLAFWVFRALYRFYLHPLSRYPGSPYAAISKSWYEWYWNFYNKGELIFEIERLHKRWGPVVRIAPNELHINDPEVFQEMTKVGSNFTKDPAFYDYVTFPGTSIGETDPARHRIRRLVLTPAFAPTRVQQLTPLIKEKVDMLLQRFDEISGIGKPIDISTSTTAFTMDIISKIVLGKELGCLQDPSFKNDFIVYLHSAFDMGWVAPSFPLFTNFSMSLPEWISEKLFPIPILEFKKKCIQLTSAYLRERSIPVAGDSANQKRKSEFNASIVIDMLADPNSAKDHSILSPGQLAEEVIMLLSAGNDTTSHSMIAGIYQIIRSPQVYAKLNKELASTFPSIGEDVTYDKVKKLPYLSAVIKEVLRYSNPLPGRAPRVVPTEGFSLYGQKLAAGTVLLTSAYLLNRHTSVWGENANYFDPDRWLEPGSPHLEKYMVSFYRGTRQCLGRDLALCELYTLFANLFRRFDVEIFNTTDEDMQWIDLLLTFYPKRNFRAKMKKKVV